MRWLLKRLALSIALAIVFVNFGGDANAWPLRDDGSRARHCNPYTYGMPRSCHQSPWGEWRS
jgi:hypothetical protein